MANKLKKPPKIILAQAQMEAEATVLFPTDQKYKWNIELEETNDDHLFALEELEECAQALKGGKAPGPDGFPSEVAKTVHINYERINMRGKVPGDLKNIKTSPYREAKQKPS